MSTAQTTIVRPVRVRVFVDFWNFQLTLAERAREIRHLGEEFRFNIDWRQVGPWLTKRAVAVVPGAETNYSFDGAMVYTSYDPRKDSDKRFYAWATGWLARQSGIHVECRERKPKAAPTCPACHQEISDCPHCKSAIRASGEKGVDTLIATDMIRLAWEDAYEIAVLATTDRDLIPSAEFLGTKGLKVVHAAFPPKGADLTRASWASFDVMTGCEEIERPDPSPTPVK